MSVCNILVTVLLSCGGVMAQWVVRWTCSQEVASLTLAQDWLYNDSGQVVHIHMILLPSSII